MIQSMKILSIETSCDETAVSLLKAAGEKNKPEFEILGDALYSQIEKHREFGGVYPSVAKREHALNLTPLLEKLLKETNEEIIPENEFIGIEQNIQKEVQEILEREPDLFESFIKYISKIKKPDVDLIAVTSGPGLEPALWVGINFARALSLVWQIPVIPVNHMEGHITSVLKESNNAEQISFPAISLLISGGHTELVLIKGWGEYEIIGRTKDDAVGEAYDKVARMLDLEYPGGPKISALADIARSKIKEGELDFEKAREDLSISLPRPMIGSNDFDFSFSGIKTAVLYLVKKLKEENGEGENSDVEKTKASDKILNEEIKSIVALEFETSVAEVLLKKTKKALEKYDAEVLIIGGGVIANKNIRETFSALQNNDETTNETTSETGSDSQTTKVFIPEIDLTTDNSIMIGIAGYLKSFDYDAKINPEIIAEGNLSL